MENSKIVCPICSVENSATAKYCSDCGAALQNGKILVKECSKCKAMFDKQDMFCGLCGDTLVFTEIYENDNACENTEAEYCVICKTCGAENFKGFNFCSCCGASLLRDQKTATVSKKKIKVTEKTKMLNSVLLLLLAAVLFAFSFLPIFTMDMDILESVSLKVKFNAYETMALAIDNMQSRSEKNLKESALYEQYEECEEEFKESINLLENSSLFSFPVVFEKNTNKLLKCATKLYLRSEDTPISFSIIISSLASLTFIIACYLALLFAFFTFLSNFTTVSKNTKECVKCIILAPFMAAVSCIAFGISNKIGSLSFLNVSLVDFKTSSPVLLFAIIPAFLIVSALIIQNAVFKKKAFVLKHIIINFLILAFSVGALVLSTSSILNVNVKSRFKNKETETTVTIPLNADFYENFVDSDKNLIDLPADIKIGSEKYAEYIRIILKLYKDYTVREVKKGEADITTKTIILLTVYGVSDDNSSRFSEVWKIMLISVCLIALVGALSLIGIALGIDNSLTLSVISLITATLSVVALIRNIGCIKIINESFKFMELDNVLNAGAGMGILFFSILTVLMLAAACISIFIKTKKHIEQS